MRSVWTRKLASPSPRPVLKMRWARSRTAPAFSNVRAAAVSEIARGPSWLSSVFFKRAADRIDQILRLYRLGAVIAGGFLGGDLDMRIRRHEIVGEGDA